MPASQGKLTFVFLKPFVRAAKGVLGEDDIRAIEDDLQREPERYPVMPETGGFRKMRYAPESSGKGKRGGVRVIYFYRNSDGRVSFAALIRKSQRETLTKEERNQL